jgi:glutathione peroxidase
MTTAFDFQFEDLRGDAFPLSQFSGHPMVIANTASLCGFTPQYAGLEALWRTWRDKGLIVLGVPCNDFDNQEPGDSGTIAAFCTDKYGVDFPLTAKAHVRGPASHPLFQWLAQEGGFLARPRWNFYKFLIGKDGQLRSWFSSFTPPGSRRLARAVEQLLTS